MPFRLFAPLALFCGLAASVASAGVLDRMKEAGEIRIAVRADARPLSWMDGDAPGGYSVALCQLVAQQVAKAEGIQDLTYTYVEVNAKTRFSAIAEGEADILCGAATVTIARRELVDFSIPTFVDGASVMLPADGAKGFSDLAGKKIGVLGGTTTEQGLRATLEKSGLAAEVVTVDAHHDGLKMLSAGDLDAYFGDQSILFSLLIDAGKDAGLRIGKSVLTVEPHALALPLGDTAFRRAVDRALSHMYRSGAVASAFSQHFPMAEMGTGMKALMLIAPQPD